MPYYSIVVLLVVVLTATSAVAQLHADFSTDRINGCSPLAVSFTNSSTGITASTTYEWDFGNGNNSTLKDAGAIFINEQQYTVTLTLKDGPQQSVVTKTITVFKKPAVDFTQTPLKGCAPFSVSFTSTSLPGDGTIASHYWDFGDGNTQQIAGPATDHSYAFQQSASVSLVVTNSNGCTNSTAKKNIITVLPALVADFSTPRTAYCLVTDPVRFTNTSHGAGTLTYQWDFGDGGTTTDIQPVHTYAVKGNYLVKLTVSSSEGCSISKVVELNVANFSSSFAPQNGVCVNNDVLLGNTSSPVPEMSTWLIDGTTPFTTYNSDALAVRFATQGNHTVLLTNSFGQCQQSASQTLAVNQTINLAGFVNDLAAVCGSPVKVNFKDTTRGAVKWLWKFTGADNSPTSESQTPSYTYTTDDLYTVSLTVSNASGCSNSISKTLFIGKPLVGIFSTDANGNSGCEGITKNFVARSTEEIKEYLWNFGDGTTSTEKEPIHPFGTFGSFTVKLSFKTISGCTGTVAYDNLVTVQRKIVADFTGPVSVCGNTPVTFHSTSTGDINTISWNYGDNNLGYGFYNTHKFMAEGDYTITFIALNYGCADTIVKRNYIHVNPPFAKIASISNSCEGTRGTVTFTDASTQTNNWAWDFGDGTTTAFTTPQTSVKHTYTKSGSYSVVLTNVNGTCILHDTAIAYVLLRQQPLLTISKPAACTNTGLAAQIGNLERPEVPFPYDQSNSYSPYSYSFQTIDGTVPPIYVSGNNASLPWSGTLTASSPSQQPIRVITTSNPFFGCQDTSNIIPLTVKGPTAAFSIIENNVCFKSPARFQDQSQANNSVPIVKWEWSFGDGLTATNAQGGTISHRYSDPGNLYYASLQITDADGCVAATAPYTQVVAVTGPKAAFSASATNVPLNATVSFTNTTNTYNSTNTQYQWDFGDGAVSTAYSPDHLFTVAGTYTVTLIATNSTSSCGDTVSQNIKVKYFNTAFSTSAIFIGSGSMCAPALAHFTNNSTSFVRIRWDFGDGSTLENQNNPSHIYQHAGNYIVTLFVYGLNGLTGTYRDTIRISSPSSTLITDGSEGCIGSAVKLTSPQHNNTSAYFWDFGDGHIVRTTDSFAVNNYLSPGTYSPSLLSQDANGCTAVVPLAEPIIIRPAPVIAILPANPILCQGGTIQLTASGASTYLWSPANGLNNYGIASPVASPASTTTYVVSGKDDKGCPGQQNITVTVAPPFTIDAGRDKSICNGASIQLNVTGAQNYEWIKETSGINDINSANPVATPVTTTNYTVVGYDGYHCFTDTANVKVIVHAVPSVEAGVPIEAVVGSEIQLHPVVSADVVRWSWSPSDYLSCADCPTPLSKPRAPIDYKVNVYNEYNCSASDELKISVVCAGGQIYIPAAFSPNNDGKNDLFVIRGNGVRTVKSLRIYNRWGEVIFQRRDFFPDDASAGWDGNYKNVPAPAGIYVFIAEMQCSGDEVFTRKGTLTLVR